MIQFRVFYENENVDQTAGILLYSVINEKINVFLITPGGPYFKFGKLKKWGIPKGKLDTSESIEAAAIREFEEETGIKYLIIKDKLLSLGSVAYSKKNMYAFAFLSDGTERFIKSNTFELEWPPKSGKIKRFPEIHDGQWFEINEAKKLIGKKQLEFLIRLETMLKNI